MNSRRDFLRSLAFTASAPLILSARSHAQAPAAKLELTDPVALALGYNEDATKVDAQKFPQHKDGQNCSGCALYQGKPGETSGPCSVFGGKIVASGGWCATFAPKPPAPAAQ